jgi:1,4-dihydroxy-2-naphthoate octaprenyltransferase
MTSTTAPSERGFWTRLRPWIALQELPKHLANVFPYLLGTTLAYWQWGSINWGVFAVGLFALFLLTDGSYIANEYFDYDNDRLNQGRIGGSDGVGVTTTGGTRVLVQGLIPRRHALIAAIAAFLLAIPVGLYLQLVLDTGPLTIPLGVLGLLIGWFYSAPPVKASYRGLGEAFIAVGQGVVVFGAFYIQWRFSILPLVVALPWFFALPALKILREFPDLEADRAVGKRGLTLRLGPEWAAIVYDILISLALTSLVPIYFILSSPAFWIVLVPAFFLVRSVVLIAPNGWRDRRRAEAAAVSGFAGMLLIPVALALAFLAAAWLRH